MILDVFRCNQLFSDVLCCFLMFSAWLQLLCMTTPCAMHNHPLCRHFLRMMSDVFRCSIDVFRRSQLFSDFLRMTSIDHVLARVYWTRASTCIKYTCQHVYNIHVLARVLYTGASTSTLYTCQHVCILHVLGQRSQVFGTDFKVKVEVLFCIINIVLLSSLTTNVNPALLTPSPSPP